MGNLTEQCRGVVDGYGRALLKDFIEEMDADDVCTMFILCEDNEEAVALNLDNSMWPVKRHHKHHKHHRKHHHHHKHHHKHRSACEFSINHARKLMNHHETDKAALRSLNSMCSFLQLSSNECSQLVNKQLRSILKFMKTSPNDEICDLVHGHLKASKRDDMLEAFNVDIDEVHASKNSDASDGMSCMVCKTVMEEVGTFLKKENWTELEKNVETACKKFPTNISDMCGDLVDKAFADINELVKHFDAKEVCNDLKMCDKDFNFLGLLLKIVQSSGEIEGFVKDLKSFVRLSSDGLPKSFP